MHKADFITSLVLLGLAIYMIVEGWRLPGAGGFIEIGGEPGRVPVMLGIAIGLLALLLLARAIAGGGHRIFDRSALPSSVKVGAARCAAAAVICSFYAVGLVGAEVGGWRVPYPLATFLFLFAFVLLFEWRFAPELGAATRDFANRRAPSLARVAAAMTSRLPAGTAPYLWLFAMALLQAVIVTFAVTWLFESQFYVKLP